MRIPVFASAVPQPLGSWIATRWQYVGRDDPSLTADLVVDLGGTVTLSLSEDTFVVTFALPQRGVQGIGGTYVATTDELVLTEQGSSRRESLGFRHSGETLSLRSAESAWDFDGDGRDEPASLVAVFVRL